MDFDLWTLRILEVKRFPNRKNEYRNLRNSAYDKNEILSLFLLFQNFQTSSIPNSRTDKLFYLLLKKKICFN